MFRTETLKVGRPKNKPELKQPRSERVRALRTAQKTTPQEKTWVEDGSEKNSVKKSHSDKRKEKAVFLSTKKKGKKKTLKSQNVMSL